MQRMNTVRPSCVRSLGVPGDLVLPSGNIKLDQTLIGRRSPRSARCCPRWQRIAGRAVRAERSQPPFARAPGSRPTQAVVHCDHSPSVRGGLAHQQLPNPGGEDSDQEDSTPDRRMPPPLRSAFLVVGFLQALPIAHGYRAGAMKAPHQSAAASMQAIIHAMALICRSGRTPAPRTKDAEEATNEQWTARSGGRFSSSIDGARQGLPFRVTRSRTRSIAFTQVRRLPARSSEGETVPLVHIRF